jgi:hypothetical protein
MVFQPFSPAFFSMLMNYSIPMFVCFQAAAKSNLSPSSASPRPSARSSPPVFAGISGCKIQNSLKTVEH